MHFDLLTYVVRYPGNSLMQMSTIELRRACSGVLLAVQRSFDTKRRFFDTMLVTAFNGS